MKKLLFILVILVTSCSSYNQISDLDKYQLKGNISSIKTYKNTRSSKKHLRYKAEFNAIGNLTNIYVYMVHSDDVFEKKEYNYKKGKLISIDIYNPLSEQHTKSIQEWKGNRISKIIHDEFMYDEYIKDKQKTIIKSFILGDYRGKTIEQHNKDGYPIEQIKYDSKGKEIERAIIKWENNIPVQYSSNKCSYYTELNEYGYPKHSVNCSISYASHIVVTPDNNKQYYYEYEYDDKGNWIKCNIYEGEDKKLWQIFQREITYK